MRRPVEQRSELPVIHLELFQVVHQAEDGVVVLGLAALKVSDGGDGPQQLRQGLGGTPLDLGEGRGRRCC